ncbi:V-type proton ATPase subunit B2 [Tanacetum coccineum]
MPCNNAWSSFKILVRLDVEDLLRCKSVCKSWKTLISDRHFIKAHQNHCFNNNDNGQAMIDQVILPFYYGRVGQKYQIVGSSNGLVCINTFHGNEFSVANPWTREERIVQKHLPSQESCWGFGYDPVTNDYKIVFGVTEGMYQTSFQVLSLKSNVWKHIGHVNGICPHGELATLCNGALHWLMDPDDQENSSFIISFDLSKEVFKEIPQPDDARYNNPNKEDIPSMHMMLGIKDECLCIWRTDRSDRPNNTWIMQKYNVKESWEPLGSNFQKTNECIRYSRIGVPDIEWSNHDTCVKKRTRVAQYLGKAHMVYDKYSRETRGAVAFHLTATCLLMPADQDSTNTTENVPLHAQALPSSRSLFAVTTHHGHENSPPEVVVVNDSGGVKNVTKKKIPPAYFTTTAGITLDVRYDLVAVHSVKAGNGADMDDPELTLLAKAHQDHCFNNNDNAHTRISQVDIPIYSIYKRDQKYYIVGSANGLVCVDTFNGKEFIVANPWTREESMVQQPLASNLLCWGFGYDSLTDHYKIVSGVKEGMNQTSFHVLSLKSNVWKHITDLSKELEPVCKINVYMSSIFSTRREPRKPVEKTTRVSLALGFVPRPSSGVRYCRMITVSDTWETTRRTTVCFCQTAPPRERQGVLAFPEASSLSSAESALVCFLAQFSFFLLHLLGYPPLESFTMSLEDSGDLDIPDAAPVDPALEAGVLPKFDMHLYRSSLNETHVRYLVKLYGIPEELHPRVAPAGMTMDVLPPGAIGLYAHHFQQGGLRVPFSSFFLKVVEHFCVHISQLVPLGINRVTFFEIYCRSLDVTPTVPLFRVFYKLCKQGHWFSFQNRAGKGCQPCLKDAPTSLKKWKDKFFLVDRRAAPIAMAWRHHDSSVADPFPGSSEYNASDVAKLREVVISLRRPPLSILYVAGLSNVWKHAGRAFSIRDSEGKGNIFALTHKFKGCKDHGRCILIPGAAMVTSSSHPAARLQDIPHKTAIDVWQRAAVFCGIKGGVCCKKRRVRASAQAPPISDHVSSLTPLNQAKSLEALANETYVSPPGSIGWMDTLRDQTDEHALSPRAAHAHQLVGGEGGAAPPVFEGHGDNQDVLFGPQTRPSPAHPSGRPRTVPGKVAPEKFVPEAEASYSAGRFGNLPFTPQWGLTDSSRMDNSRECRDMLANLFTPADEEFFNEGVRDESAIRRSWKMLCQSTQQQANVLLRFEALKEQHADLVYAHESCVDVKVRFKECRKELAKVQSAYDEKTAAYDKLSKNYEGALIREKSLQDRLEELEEEKKEVDNLNSSQADHIKRLEEALKQAEADAKQLRSEKVHYAVEAGKGEIVRQKIINQYLPTFVRRLHQSAEYKRSLGEVFSLAVGKGFIEGISIGHEEEDIQAILTATPNVDPSSSETFLPAYEKLFDQRYSYVDKVARMYLLDSTELQNIMPDETGPTPGGGPRDTPTPS